MTNKRTKQAADNTARDTTTSKVERVDLYETITNKIIAELEAGTVPWARPWDDRISFDQKEATYALPCNGATGRNYSGINILILWQRADEMGFAASGG